MRIKRWLAISVVTVCLMPAIIFAQESGTGIGFILGEPTGINLKLWTGNKTALVAAAAWSFEGKESIHFHLDYLYHQFEAIPLEKGFLPFYYGVGIRVKNGRQERLGVRLPLGLNYHFKKVPLDIFAEVVPVFDLIPGTDLHFNGGVGFRYFF
ncbi:MAG: hypothetical protein ACOC57_01015 [Acidobacteriota bacterium]